MKLDMRDCSVTMKVATNPPTNPLTNAPTNARTPALALAFHSLAQGVKSLESWGKQPANKQ